jgi:hypothetical protein
MAIAAFGFFGARTVRALKRPPRHTSCEIVRLDYLDDAAVSVEPRGQVRFP